MNVRLAFIVIAALVPVFLTTGLRAESADGSRFAVPDGDVDSLVRFVSQLKEYRPQTAAEFIEHRKRFSGAIQTAAKRILALEENRQSAAARTATAILLEFRVQQLPKASREDQAATYAELRNYLHNAKDLTRNDLAMAFEAASAIECGGNCALACEAFDEFGRLFSAHQDEFCMAQGAHMQGLARRLGLLGSKIEVAGVTHDGKPLDWSRYEGKVVLVDFWVTSCRTSSAELANVRQQFAKYHERGFEVVGVSLDSNRRKLEEYLEDKQLPWVTLFQDGAGWKHPLAANCGVTTVPTLMLIDKDGRVVSLDSSGPELDRQLASLLGHVR